MINHHDALIYAMLMVSASDGNMTDAEMQTIGEIVRTLPVFANYDIDNLPRTTQAFVKLMSQEAGIEDIFELIRDSLPKNLRETAYALAVDVVASDPPASQEELRLLEMMRHRLDIERLAAAGIERGAAARYIKVSAPVQQVPLEAY